MSKMHRIGHTGVHRNKRVRVFLRDGTNFEDVFHERSDRYVQFKKRGRIAKADIRSIAILKKQGV